ncbi:sugar ABC transporter permease [uncultured Sphaerochaeta sp.]|uniref:carbohydrate ABC transporter permease n=1 Tax=uncultured Sphaerochaeta sp. TaxID=886478 RepID=UPI002A0A607B|nr:sugar ABC transporter permease [uncultured Sphaerochaeta sp.]
MDTFQKTKLQSILDRREVQKWMVIVTFTLTPLALLIIFTYLPFAKMIEFSFFKMKYLGPRNFVGFKNYQDVFTRTDTRAAILNSFYYMGAGVIQLSLALYFATVLSFKVRCGNFFKATLFFPFLVCGIAMGFIFRYFYTRGLVLDSVLALVGFDKELLPFWLGERSINNYSIAATSIWRYMGQSMVLFIGAIQSISPEFYEAAEIDGATRMQQFRYIIFPMLKPIITLNIMLMIKGSFSAFEGPYVITNGMNGTATFVVLMHQLAHEAGKVGLASAMAIVLLLIIIIGTILQKFLYNLLFSEKSGGIL